MNVRTVLALALALAPAVLAPVAAAEPPDVAYPAPQVAVRDDSVWIGNSTCYAVAWGEPRPCEGPYEIIVVPLSANPCVHRPDAPVLCGPAPGACDVVPPGTPGLCGEPWPSTDACDRFPNLVVVCREYDACDRVPASVPYACGHEGVDLPSTDPCDHHAGAPGTCGNPPKEPCDDVPPTVPGVCGRDPPSTDPCDRLPTLPVICREYDPCDRVPAAVPHVCGHDGIDPPSTDPCERVPTAPVLCRPYDPTLPVRPGVDGFLCVYVEFENGARRDILCVAS